MPISLTPLMKWNISSKNKLPEMTQEKKALYEETKFKIKNLFLKENSGTKGCTGEFYQIFREEIIQLVYKLCQKKKRRGKNNS